MELRTIEPVQTKQAALVRKTDQPVIDEFDTQAAATFAETLHNLALQTRLTIGAHQCAMSFIPHGDLHVSIHTHSFSEKYEKYNTYDVMPTGSGIWGLVVTTKKAVRMTQEEIVAHPMWKNFSDLRDQRGLEHPPMRGWLAAPALRNTGEVMGVLQLSDKYDDAEFTGKDLDLLIQLTSLVLPAFELQSVNTQLQERKNELQAQRLAALNLAQDADEARKRAERKEEALAIANRDLLREITERQRTEEELRRITSELARSNAELEQFAYIASHDLQEPLRKVQSFGDLLVANSGEALGAEGRDYLKRMQNAAQRMQGLINDLLSYARVTSQAKEFVPVELTKVAQEVVSDLEAHIKSTSGQVNIGVLPPVAGDPLQLRQMLQNLIGNALKFHRPNVAPVVAVHCRVLKNGGGGVLQPASSEPVCELTVQDNGIGFEEKYLDRIFAPFQRLHGRGEYEGTGIGLAICRKIVERHGGTITARSAPGQGTTFIVTLPLRQAKGKTNHA